MLILESYIKVNGKMTKKRELESRSGRAASATKDSIRMA